MSSSQQYSKEQVADAIRAGEGMVTAISRILGCSVPTVRNYMNRYPELQEIFTEINESMLDLAELQLKKNIASGRESSVFYYLNNKGRNRGYGKRLGGDEDQPPPPTGDIGETKVKIKLDDDTEIEI